MLEYLPVASISPAVRAALLGRPRVLVVEDDEDLASGLSILLGRSYEVSVARDAREAAQMYPALQPDVLLVDYQLPDSNGIRLLQSLRRRDATLPPAVMLSAYSRRREASRIAGFKAFLEKPCEPLKLMWAIERAIA